MLVLGQKGQVAQELGRLGLACIGRAGVDLNQPGQAADLIARRRPRAVINAAAYTAVDRAETEDLQAMRLNGEAVAEVAQACASLGIPLVHISTDYVFDGSGSAPWSPADTPAPLSAYGRSKLAGEAAVRAAGGVHAILRTSWVFSAHGSNFVRTMLRLGPERGALSIVEDQHGAPTSARAIAQACQQMAEALLAAPEKAGTYHFAGTPTTTWLGFARETFAQAGISVDLTGIPSSAYPTPAARPLNSRLDCSSLAATFGIRQPSWQEDLRAVLQELGHAT